ncbi:MAG: polyphosphate kinase 2 [Arenimonas sp.]|nr:polyphosphate kinase 2 [Arenimonas sp.]
MADDIKIAKNPAKTAKVAVASVVKPINPAPESAARPKKKVVNAKVKPAVKVAAKKAAKSKVKPSKKAKSAAKSVKTSLKSAIKSAKPAIAAVKAAAVEVVKSDKPEKMKRKVYEAEMRKLHEELVALQQWVVHKKMRVIVVFEGRDGAGKGGVIKAISERVSPRIFRVVALPSPTEREKSQIYMQRFIQHFPAAGEIAIFDRSWYNRAGVERVLGFCSEEQSDEFLKAVPLFERAIVDGGIILLKYWLEVSEKEQTKRLKDRIDDGRKIWKLSPMDLKSYNRWYDYSRARDEMFRATDNGFAPWFVANNDDVRRGRLNIISHLLAHIPYKKLPREKIKLPKRQKAHGYVEIDHDFKYIDEKF